MSRKALNIAAGRRIFNHLLKTPENMPFSFNYGGETHRGLEGLNARRVTTGGGGKTRIITTARVDDRLRIKVDATFVEEFGQCEYTVWFENTGRKPTEIISAVKALDIRLEGRDPVLRGCLGDHDNWYAAYEHDLTKGDKYFQSLGGRATHIVFPYFDVVHGNGGTMIALGWAGTWEALFSSTSDGEDEGNAKLTRITASTDISLNTVLLPGEKIRTGLVVLLPYKGRNYDDATNLWREWFMKYDLPKADAEGHPLEPLSTVGFSSDTGLPNSDGSISERSFTWRPTLQKLIDENMIPDFRWFDAGWYFDAAGRTVETDWWGTVGTWELDSVKWPGKSFRESNEACHKLGMKVLVWFEPERVCDVPNLVKNYGYKAEWSIGDGHVRTNNLGDPDCLAWTLGRITKMMDENGVDMYREDNNSDPGFAWPFRDNQETQKLGLPRWGITENKCICGHYALWDGIIEYCAANGKCTFVDSCASGGGRIDLIIRGGWPGSIGLSAEQASLLPTEYLNAVIDDDVYRIDGVKRDTTKMRLLLRSLARNESTTVTNKTLIRDIKAIDDEDIDSDTVSSYLDIFKRLFLTDNQPPFSTGIRSSVRIKQAKKRHFSDPSLACALLHATPESLLNDLETLGFMFEALCERDLKIYAESFGASLYHYQDYRNQEIDAVIELPEGDWCAFEIKLGANQIDAAAANLLTIKKQIEEDPKGKPPAVLCVICGMSNAAYRRPDGVFVVPITALKM